MKNPGPFHSNPIVLLVVLTGILWVAAAGLGVSSASAGVTLDKVRSKGVLHCGVTETLSGFSFKDPQGRWQGFLVDFCRAVSTAVLGDGERVTFTPLTSSARFPALLSGQVDLLAHNTTLTFEREAALGIQFAGIYLFDGQGFLVPRKSPARQAPVGKG